MEVDSGASVSVIGKRLFDTRLNVPLRKSSKNLIVVNGSSLNVAGEAFVAVEFRNIQKNLKLLVLDSDHDFIPLIGRTWLDVFFPNWHNFFDNSVPVNNVGHTDDDLMNKIKDKFSGVFIKDFSSPINGYEAELVLKTDTPIFRKAYDVPYRLRDKVLIYLDRLEKAVAIP